MYFLQYTLELLIETLHLNETMTCCFHHLFNINLLLPLLKITITIINATLASMNHLLDLSDLSGIILLCTILSLAPPALLWVEPSSF